MVTERWEDELVSVILPVYNERAALRDTILELQEAMQLTPHQFEVILVDDYSTDGGLETVRDLDVQIIRHERREGGGVARMTWRLVMSPFLETLVRPCGPSPV